jgi:hypothetical protein
MVTPHSKPVTSAIAGPRQQGSPNSRRAAVLQDCTRSQTRAAREPTHHETQQPPRQIAETKWSEDKPCTHRGHRETARMEVGLFDANGILDKTITPTVCKPRAGHNAKRSSRTAIILRGWGGAGKGGPVLAVRKNTGHRGLCPSHEVPREGRRPRRPQGKAGPRGPHRTCRASQSENTIATSDRLGGTASSRSARMPGTEDCASHDLTGGVAAARGLRVPPPLADPDPTLDPGPPALSIRPHITCTPNLPHPDKPPSGINKNCLTIDVC